MRAIVHCYIVCLPFGANHYNLNENRPILPAAKCSAETLVCEDVKAMPIFVGVRWIGDIK